jgi:hypothetical protein
MSGHSECGTKFEFDNLLQDSFAAIIFCLFISPSLIEPGAVVHQCRPGSYSLVRLFVISYYSLGVVGMGARSTKQSPQYLLETFWRRHSFHDMAIESLVAINRRVLIRLEEYTLVITEVSKFSKEIEEFPTSWVRHKWTERGNSFDLIVEAELGKFEVVGRDVRLFRNADMAILIPAVDL